MTFATLALLCSITVDGAPPSADRYEFIRVSTNRAAVVGEIEADTIAVPNFDPASPRVRRVGASFSVPITGHPFSTPYPRQEDFAWLQEALRERAQWYNGPTKSSFSSITTVREMRQFAESIGTNLTCGITAPPSGVYYASFPTNVVWDSDVFVTNSAIAAAIRALGGDSTAKAFDWPFPPCLTNHTLISRDAFEPVCDAINETGDAVFVSPLYLDELAIMHIRNVSEGESWIDWSATEEHREYDYDHEYYIPETGEWRYYTKSISVDWAYDRRSTNRTEWAERNGLVFGQLNMAYDSRTRSSGWAYPGDWIYSNYSDWTGLSSSDTTTVPQPKITLFSNVISTNVFSSAINRIINPQVVLLFFVEFSRSQGGRTTDRAFGYTAYCIGADMKVEDGKVAFEFETPKPRSISYPIEHYWDAVPVPAPYDDDPDRREASFRHNIQCEAAFVVLEWRNACR